MQLVSESVKTKQAQSALLSEKQALAKQLQQINTSVESLKMRISRSEVLVRFPHTNKKFFTYILYQLEFESCRWSLV